MTLFRYAAFVALCCAIGACVAVGVVVWPVLSEGQAGEVNGAITALGLLLVPTVTGVVVGAAHWAVLRRRLGLPLTWTLSLAGGVALGFAAGAYTSSNAAPFRSSALAPTLAVGLWIGLLAGAIQAVALGARGVGTRGAALWCAGVLASWAGAFLLPVLVPTRLLGLPATSTAVRAVGVSADTISATWLAIGTGTGALFGALTVWPLIQARERLRCAELAAPPLSEATAN